MNVLALDEPTNDLDIETLDLLEEVLLGFSGTLLLVSHDRDFIDNVVTSTLVMEGNGQVGEFVGGYTDWVRQKAARVEAKPPAPKREPPPQPKPPGKKRKLSFKEARELDELPVKIEGLEQERQALYAALADLTLLKNGAATAAAKARLAALDGELGTATARWESLASLS
jgi:ATP-binding cassette subfamily F protein uup